MAKCMYLGFYKGQLRRSENWYKKEVEMRSQRQRKILTRLRALGGEEAVCIFKNELPPEIQAKRQALIREAENAGLNASQIEQAIQRGYREAL